MVDAPIPSPSRLLESRRVYPKMIDDAEASENGGLLMKGLFGAPSSQMPRVAAPISQLQIHQGSKELVVARFT